MIKIKQAKPGDADKQGIHLLDPTPMELQDAKDTAIAKGFDCIYIHTDKTWPYKTGRHV